MSDVIDVDRLAKLAAIHLSGSERERLADDLRRLAGAVAELEGAAPGVERGVSGARHAGPTSQRPDEPTPSLPRSRVEAIAPRTEDGHVAVPPVFQD